MRNIKLTIEYDGKEFNGWQKQPNKLNIQGTIEQAIKTITGEDVDLQASGRTDAGVHALGQVANFKTNSKIPIEKFPIAINSKIKKSIVITNAEEVEERFHSRYNCKRKTYRYVIDNSEFPTPIYRYLEYHIPNKLNIEAMKNAAKYFEELKEQMQKQYEYHQSILSDEAEKAKFNDRQIGYMEAYTQEFIKEKQQDVVNYILGCWPGKMAEKFAEAIGYSK